jgi:translin
LTMPKSRLESIAEQIRLVLASKDAAREKALPLCREIIRHCSDTIRAVHRHEFDTAAALLDSARNLLNEAHQSVTAYPELQNAGFIRDAQKEFAEASLTLAMVTGRPLPEPGELGVEAAAYLNGLGEAVGELRRYLLDGVRQNDFSQSEQLLSAMDAIYNILVGMDFPDAITNGLRRTTDTVRSILERTRSDLTLIMKQQELKQKLDSLELEKEAE